VKTARKRPNSLNPNQDDALDPSVKAHHLKLNSKENKMDQLRKEYEETVNALIDVHGSTFDKFQMRTDTHDFEIQFIAQEMYISRLPKHGIGEDGKIMVGAMNAYNGSWSIDEADEATMKLTIAAAKLWQIMDKIDED
jgi:hypothetical protein